MKQKLTHDEFMEMGSDRAEESHHKHCEYACCGEHDSVFTNTCHKCPECGMTEEIQDAHNDEWWSAIDSAEADIMEEYEVEGT